MPPAEGDESGESVAVWSTNWTALRVFIECATQWRAVAGYGFFATLGLDYPGVEVVMRAHEIEDRAAVFRSVQAMELAALPILNQRE